MNSTRIAATKIRRWRDDPVAFVREEFGIEPDAWQVDFLLSYNTQTRTAAKACKGPGKTAVLAWCCWHFLATRPHANIAATSITGDNLRDGLWKEMAKWQMRSDYLKAAFTWKAERITCNDHPETWFMSARRWARDATGDQQANSLAGLHEDHIMFVIDEAGGVPDAVMAAAEAALANAGTEVNPDAEARLLICGNPTHLSGPLYRACSSEASLWSVIEITGDPDNPKRSPRISKEWARQQIFKYGADNSWVLVNVFGRFPPQSLNALLGPDDMEAAFRRVLPQDAYSWAPKILGVDVARQGDDRSVIAPRQGLVYFKPKIMRIPDTMQVAAVVAQAINKFRPDAVFVDASGGYGVGVIDRLRDLGHDCIEVQFGGKALDRLYFDKRTEMAFEFAQAVKGGACLPDLPELKEEAVAMTYEHKADRMKLIEKDQIKETIGRSPDLFDAYMLTHAFPVAKREAEGWAKMAGRQDYDPIRDMHSRPTHSPVDEYNPLR